MIFKNYDLKWFEGSKCDAFNCLHLSIEGSTNPVAWMERSAIRDEQRTETGLQIAVTTNNSVAKPAVQQTGQVFGHNAQAAVEKESVYQANAASPISIAPMMSCIIRLRSIRLSTSHCRASAAAAGGYYYNRFQN